MPENDDANRDEEEFETDEPDNEPDEDDEDEDAGKDADTLKAELKRTREALKKSNAESKKRRLAAKVKPTEEVKKDVAETAEEAETRLAAKWKPKVIRQGAKAALSEAGASNPARLVGLLDMDSLDIDDDGEVDGLEDEIDRLKDEFPELFRKKRTAALETGDRSGGKGAARPKSDSERQAAAILGRK